MRKKPDINDNNKSNQREKGKNVTISPNSNKSGIKPAGHSVPSISSRKSLILDEDYLILTNPIKLAEGLLLSKIADQYVSNFGKIIFQLAEIPISVNFLTEKGTKLCRISQTEILLDDGKRRIFLPNRSDRSAQKSQASAVHQDPTAQTGNDHHTASGSQVINFPHGPVPLPHLGLPYGPPSAAKTPVPLKEEQKDHPKEPEVNRSNIRANAADYMRKTFTELETGRFNEALQMVENSLKELGNAAEFQKEIHVAQTYKTAISLLLQISYYRAKGDEVKAAILSKFLADLKLKPNHRLIAIRSAISANMKLQNYNIAARFIRELLSLNLPDQKTLEYKLRICQENNFRNESIPDYECPRCKQNVLPAGEFCDNCHAEIDFTYFFTNFSKQEVEKSPIKVENQPAIKEKFEQVLQKNESFGQPAVSPVKVKTKRDEVVSEILSTEKTYVESLDILIKLYVTPISAHQIVEVTKDEVKSVFSSLKVIHSCNSLLFSKLDERLNQWSPSQLIADIFLQHVDLFRVYTSYINNYNTAFLNTINDWKKTSEEFDNLLKTNARICGGSDFESLLILPVQRLPRYILLLQELLKNTDTLHPDYENIRNAVAKMKAVTDYVNESKRNADRLKEFVEVCSTILVPLSEEPLIQPSRYFIMKGEISQVHYDKVYTELQKKKFTCFLFNDLLVIAREAHFASGDPTLLSAYQSFSQLVSVKFKEVQETVQNTISKIKDDNYEGLFRIVEKVDLNKAVLSNMKQDQKDQFPFWETGFEIDSKKKEYLFAASSVEEKDRWVKAIEKAIANLHQTIKDEDIAFEEMSPADWNFIFSNASSISLAAGTEIKTDFEKSGDFFRLVSGKAGLKLQTNGSVAKNIVSLPWYPGDFCAENLFFGEKALSATVVAETELQLLSIEATVVQRLLALDPIISRKFFRSLASFYAYLLKEATSESHTPSNISQIMSKLDQNTNPHENALKSSLSFSQSLSDNASVQSSFVKLFAELHMEIVLKATEAGYTRNIIYFGTLYITQQHLCFYAKTFGVVKKRALSLHHVTQLEKVSQHRIEIRRVKNNQEKLLTFTFRSTTTRNQVMEFMNTTWKNLQQISRRRNTLVDIPSNHSSFVEPEDTNLTFSLRLPNKKDWEFILKGAKLVTFAKDDVIVHEGDIFRRVYQIAAGNCRIEKNPSSAGSSVFLGRLGPSDVFGEISFLDGGQATANVIADSERVEVYLLENYSLSKLFDLKPEIAARFYQYISKHLMKRLQSVSPKV